MVSFKVSAVGKKPNGGPVYCGSEIIGFVMIYKLSELMASGNSQNFSWASKFPSQSRKLQSRLRQNK